MAAANCPLPLKTNPNALLDFLAEKLDVPRRAIPLLHGDKRRQKVVRRDGLDLAEAKRRLGAG